MTNPFQILRKSRLVGLALFTALLQLPLTAQADPMHEIQEIARSVDEQLQEIDRLLLESGRKNQVRSRPKEMLQKAHEQSESVEGGIDQLIEKLTQMKNQSSSSSSQGEQQQQQPKDGQSQPRPGQGQGQQNRRENQTPDFVQQPQQGEQQGQQQQPQPGQGEKPDHQPQGKPQGGQEAPGPGQNQPATKPPDSELGPGQPGQGEGTWGELQPYVNFLKNRGSPPKVPEKFRKYWEAYLKTAREGGGK